MIVRFSQSSRLVAALAAVMAAALFTVLCVCPLSAFADKAHSQVADSTEMGRSRMLGSPDMVPVEGADVVEGTYNIEVESSSSFFKINSAKLVVKDGKMNAIMTMNSSSYTLVYMGTGQEAAAAPADDYIPFESSSKTFTVPVSMLDANIDCAAFSKNRKKWYDRKLMFKASSLPANALLVELPEYEDTGGYVQEGVSSGSGASGDGDPVAARVKGYPDGEYSIEVDMVGGSGRASVSSPTWLTIRGGRAFARLLWSSSYYDYMIVGGKRFDNETDDGSNSTFTIPITVFDEEIDVVADTTAMGDPVEIDYHLTFYSDTIGEKNLIPQEAAILVLEIAVVIIVVGGILNHILKKRRKR